MKNLFKKIVAKRSVLEETGTSMSFSEVQRYRMGRIDEQKRLRNNMNLFL